MRAGRESQLTAEDGTTLFVCDWPLETGVGKGGVVVMHGLGEHCGRYEDVARFFNERGWNVRTYDHRGHGRSGGARGDVPDHEAILRDAKLVLDDFARQFDAPPLLIGQSMGGLYAARFATGGFSPLRGLILSSPALAIPLSATQKLLLNSLGAISPGLGVPNGLDPAFLSHDQAVVDGYVNDPLVHTKITPRLLRSMLHAVDAVQTRAPTLAIPTLLVVSGDDRMVDASGSEAFFARLQPDIRTMHRYPGYYHDILHEVNAEHVFGDIEAWLQANGF